MGFDLEISVPALTVFIQGILSFFSPCVLPLVPLYVGYLAGGAKTVEADGTIRCTHEEIGAAVGVSRVTVSRVLGDLAKAGAVSTGYRTLKIANRASLQHMAESEGR